ncbi:VanZ family protein [Oceanobacillus luteolus]|uniref:VanZ family protein n=1 Tax=Oceanobacillus luteolus TaxID=1274358 RepID=A0ABW4HPR5_9BACI|nr:VanZ family protein [Oceanobacillus luteolus]MCM3740240.1 VanZ family protein [Oceanobacillus luteolus]
MRKPYLYWLLPIIWMGIIFYSSATPYDNQDMKPLLGDLINFSFIEPYLEGIYFTYNGSPVSLETHGAAGLVEFFIRKSAHVLVFLILTLLFKYALGKTTDILWYKQIILSFFLTAAYAIMDEIHQGFTPNRTPYAGDVVLDCLGALGAIGILSIFKFFRENR